jgi:triacylglycerol lipase
VSADDDAGEGKRKDSFLARLGKRFPKRLEALLAPVINPVMTPLRGAGKLGAVQDLRGGSHALSYLRHLARGNTLPRRAFYETVSEQRPPVLLIHGFLGTRGSMWPLEERMLRDGIVVFSFNLGTFNSRDIRTSAFLIHRKIESILAQTSVKRIDVVGHSMGGLIGLYYVKKLGGFEKVRKLVMMGTPISGTWIALAGVATLGLFSASSWQLLPGSSFLRELAAGPIPKSVQVYSIAAARDWVTPPDSTLLDGAKCVRVPLGHSSLVVSEDVYQHVADALAEPAPPAPGEQTP